MSDEPAECPLCMEALEIDDHSFFPCTCGYQICRFCWHRIRTDENGLCPACRKQYPEDPAEFKPLTEDELQNIKKERKQKDVQRKQKAAENRKHLANVRVVQRNLVFVVGLSPRLADPEVLKKHEYFGKFGKIHKVVINQSTSYAGSQGPSASAYVTYVKPEDALRAILTVNNVHVEGRTLKTSLGTTKYCSHFLKGTLCQKNDCMYLHELGEDAASFTKDEMQAGKHQDYEQMLIEQFLNAQNSANNHVLAHSKLKKSVLPQTIDNPENIPSLMDMTGDIKHSLPINSSSPLLPNPVPQGANGHQPPPHPSSGWPLLDASSSSSSSAPGGGGGGGGAKDLANKTQGHSNSTKGQARTSSSPENTAGGGSSSSINGNSKAVGAGRQRGSNSVNSINSTDENHIPSGSIGSSGSPSASPSGVEEDVSSSSPSIQSNGPSLASRDVPLQPSPTSNTNNAMHLQGSLSHQPAAAAVPEDVNNIIGAIGSNRRPLLSDPSGAQGLSFFGNNLLNPSTARSAQPPSPNASSQEALPSVSPLPNQEMAETLPVSSSTDWSAAFGFNSKDLPPDDDLGFDPCAESFKGLADLIEKENSGLQQQQHQHQHLMTSSGQQHTRLGSPSQLNGFPHHPLAQAPQQSNTQPSLRNLPPGFSISHIQQQQQQQHFFRPDLSVSGSSSSKMLELLPQFPPVSSQQRFLPSYSSMPLDLHSHTQPQSDLYKMKDMQDQLRSMLPNINISFGSVPHQAPPQQQQQIPPNSLHHTQHLNKSWPLSSSPESPWNDPAILTTSQFNPDATESAPHWLKSLQQLTETSSDTVSMSPQHRLPFVQQFPLAGATGWPPHTHNPPPGFRTPGISGQQTTETHQMAEVLQ